MNMQGTRQSYMVRNSSPGMPVMPLLTNTGGPHKEGWVLTCPLSLGQPMKKKGARLFTWVHAETPCGFSQEPP